MRHVERPENRTFPFDPVQRVLIDRGGYIAAAMTIVRAYLAAGCPGKLNPLASFSLWSDNVRSPLVWLGCADPAEAIRSVRENDPVLTTLQQVLECWHKTVGSEEKTAQQLINMLGLFDPNGPEDNVFVALRAALAPIVADRGVMGPHALALGSGQSRGGSLGA